MTIDDFVALWHNVTVGQALVFFGAVWLVLRLGEIAVDGLRALVKRPSRRTEDALVEEIVRMREALDGQFENRARELDVVHDALIELPTAISAELRDIGLARLVDKLVDEPRRAKADRARTELAAWLPPGPQRDYVLGNAAQTGDGE